MLNLIKKDYLIVRKIWLIVMLVAILIPAFLTFAGSGMTIPAGITLTVMSTLLAMTLFSSIDEEEEKYPKAAALITTIGYSRSTQVIKRYILMIMVFFYSAFIYFIESFFITELGNITIMNFVTSIFVFIITASLYLLLTTLFGVRAGRYIVMSVIVLISLGPTIISKLRIKINFDFLKNLNDSLLIIILLISTLLIYLISLKISIISYSNKEL